ncbi:MAG TPA: ExbD/TolR family protein [Thermoanaerobaculia bacterium]
MALNLQRSTIRSEINVTPLVDVCLVLLIIFMVVMPILQAGVKVDLPKTAEGGDRLGDQNQLNVSIRDDGVYLTNDRIADGQLRDILVALHTANPDRQVIVRGDRYLHYERICDVLTLLNEAGFERVGLVTEKKEA